MLLAVAGLLLLSIYLTEENTRKLIGTKQRHKHHCNRQVKPLGPVDVGDTIYMQLPGRKLGVVERAQPKQAPEATRSK